MSTTTFLLKVLHCKGEEYHNRLGDAFQRKDVHSRPSFASSPMMGLSFPNHREKKTIRQSSTILDIQPKALCSQTRKQKSTTRTWRLSLGSCGGRFNISAIVGKTAMNLAILIRGGQEKLPDCQKVRKVSNAASKTSLPWLQFPKRKQHHPLNSRLEKSCE